MNKLTTEHIELARRELLDIGLRGNTLLHLKPSAKTLEIVQERSREVYSILVEQQRHMVFSPVPGELMGEDDQLDESLPLPSLLDEKLGDSRFRDNKLQTKLTTDNLDKRLLRISTEANTYYQEQGVDILYLALGFLTWYEDSNSSISRRAPLVLVPVSLERASARERFRISYTQADLGPNLSLAAKLKMEFRIELPEFDEEFVFDKYLEGITQSVKGQPRWQVSKDEITLGFFSFGKFQMYQDLDPKNWPEDKPIINHPVLMRLFGDGFNDLNHIEGRLDEGNDRLFLDPVNLHFVKDADSSQTEAVMAAKRGANLVIQGPPGTGKSQTITNIISESLADGKKVLFVAEKMAALEVVKRRLDECHLGDAVLELHSHKSNKKLVLEEIKRTLELGLPDVEDRSQDKKQYTRLKEQLDNYCVQVSSPLLKSGVNFISALGHFLKLKNTSDGYTLPQLDFQRMASWDMAAYNETCALVQQLVNHISASGTPSKSPFAGTTLEDFSPFEQEQIIALLNKSINLIEQAESAGKLLAQEMQLPVPKTMAEVGAVLLAVIEVLHAPDLTGVPLSSYAWNQDHDQVEELISTGQAIRNIQEKRHSQLLDQAWQANLIKTRQILATVGQKWWNFLSGEYRTAKRELQGLMTVPLPKKASERVELLDDILSYQALSEKNSKHSDLGKNLFGAQWKGDRSDWDRLRSLTDWIRSIQQDIRTGAVPAEIHNLLNSGYSIKIEQERVDHLGEILKAALSQAYEGLQRLRIRVPGYKDTSIEKIPIAHLVKSFTKWKEHIDLLHQMTQYNRITRLLCDNGFGQLVDASFDWQSPPELLLTALEHAWYGGLVEHAYNERIELRQFYRTSHENIIKEFRRLDSQLFHFAQESLISKLFREMPHASGGAGEMAIIRKEMNKRRRHLPIRKLVSQAGRAIQQIKPIFMMSPMSVATYLEQGAVEFDLVVFDEASQVKVVDALGPILRGKQVVVVGDTRQMPPTDFFGKALDLDDDEAEASQTADIESILSMFLSKSAPEKMLRWHYRSRHDSLIAVSNKEFYDNKLMIFPSPGINPDAKGLRFRHLPDTTYDRGGSATNLEEARGVAEAVIQHAKLSPNLTLGVVAFSTAQRDAIILEIERLRRQDPSCEIFFTNNSLEGFFVKNLENVQGDERDVIFISIGYGRMASGNVTGNFGPLNKEGGERRLNVLITRARLCMEVFCNFTADALKTTDASPFGVKALKSFLKYAETGKLEIRKETGKETESPFEDEVINAIRGLGYDVEPQVGSAGFFIDIAVRDPEKPGRYILAVECDGASYHSSASARDRDRLRQTVLEGLGWRFHRIWSTDWFRTPSKETQRLKEAIEASACFYKQADENRLPTLAYGTRTHNIIERKLVGKQSASVTNSYVIMDGALEISSWPEIHELSLNKVTEAIKKVMVVEAPIHVKEVAKRIANAAGYARVGARIMAHIERASLYGHRKGTFYLEDNFIYSSPDKPAEVRDRSALPPASRNIEFVSSVEIAKAVLLAVDMSFSLSRQEAISEALSLLGFQKATEKARERLEDVISKLEADGMLCIKNDTLQAP